MSSDSLSLQLIGQSPPMPPAAAPAPPPRDRGAVQWKPGAQPAVLITPSRRRFAAGRRRCSPPGSSLRTAAPAGRRIPDRGSAASPWSEREGPSPVVARGMPSPQQRQGVHWPGTSSPSSKHPRTSRRLPELGDRLPLHLLLGGAVHPHHPLDLPGREGVLPQVQMPEQTSLLG